jgi:carbon monoxide dehydrogenase subunit G
VLISNTFVVPVDVERAWDALLDLERVAPCMPGAALQSFDGDIFTGTVSVKLGALTMKYQGSGRFLERDRDNRRVAFEAKGRETRGSGTANATVTATLHEDGAATRVDVETDLNIGGRAAQFGRGVLNDVANRLLDQFAGSLAEELVDRPPEEPPPAESSGPATTGPPPTPRAAAEPIDLVDLGRGVLLKRALAPAGVLAVLFVVGGLWRRKWRRSR